MPAKALKDFMLSPFGIIADVKMLNFFRDIGIIGLAVLASLILLSVVIQNFWCRFLCPYGALMGIVAALSPLRIRRDAVACIDCGECTKACPASLPVDRLIQVQSLECSGCMQCVAVCPAEHALQLSLPPRQQSDITDATPITTGTRWQYRVLRPEAVAAVLAILFFGLIGLARTTGHWQTNIPQDVYRQMVPHAAGYDH